MEQQIELLPQISPATLPEELQAVVSNSGIQKAEYHAATFAPFMMAVKEFSNKATTLNKDQPGPLDAQIARQIRLAMVKNRSAAEQAKDSGKSSLIAEGNVIQSLFNVVVSTNKLVEADLTAIEKHAELKEQARQAALRLDRMAQLEPYLPNPEIYPLGTMTDGAFENLLTGSRLALEQKQLAEQQAEEARLRAEAEQLAEQARIREENERLKKEAEERQVTQSYRLATLRPLLLPTDDSDLSLLWTLSNEEFANVIEIATAKRAQFEDEAKKIQAEVERQQAIKDAQLEQDRKEREAKIAEIEESNRLAREKAAQQQAENERLAAELRARDEEEAQFRKQAEEAEAARLAAEIEAAKAPDKDKLKAWMTGAALPDLWSVDTKEAGQVAIGIREKFESFKTWALQQIEAL